MTAAVLVGLVVACAGSEGGGPASYEARRESTSDPAANPLAGAFFNDGSDGDIRARSENYFVTDLGTVAPGLLHSSNIAKAGGLPMRAGGGSLVDELVVVERADGTKANYGPDRIAALRAKVDGKEFGQPLPLQHTDVRGKVALNVSSVTVTQTYTNPYAEKIEAVYVFPLPQDAAVSDFVMVIGERRIRGVVREREEAQRIYQQAKAQGYRASLMSQERPNVFTQSVANIEPQSRIDVETTYFQSLPWRDGAFEMVVPTVVGPRFHPPGSEGGVGAVAVGAEGTSGQPVEVAYRTPEAAAEGPAIDIAVELTGGMPLGAVECPSHTVTIRRDDERSATVALQQGVEVPNRDFVLRFAPKDPGAGGAVSVYRDADSGEGWFSMLIQPPLEQLGQKPQPREMVFVVDCSGSMSGEPLAACKRAMRRCLGRLGEGDTFSVLRFSDTASALAPRPLPATPENVRRGLAYVDALDSSGGTMMERGILAALQPPLEAGRRRIVTFMTDGFIGNERDILRAVHQHVGDARIFSFGVGSSTNRYLLERMADLGRGVAAFVDIGESGERQVDELFTRLERPALADLHIDWGDASVHCVEPQRLPDLFVGRPLLVHGRVRGALPRSVTVHGTVGATPQQFALPIAAADEHPAIQKLWARARIRSLADAMAYVATPEELRDEIRELALAHGLTSEFTSFLAVDSSEVTAGAHGTTVTVPAPMPRGVRYDTTVSGGER
ncbi:MAG: VIT domain-containing protein [Planctomycetota bacterium]